ncbi:type I-C CRISPR-associated protein Cas8c/Csd1 [Geomicrobium sp. JCM 19039]|uniref:type I-C CRISPR-associated protein Cas8c/Csd1 n=1 Tax=Geomicrobium sp. JCM 19039 TaxID=1460636 RepID=UPI00045F44CB|nr:type I-C CRISPR-associated protein Cas8c/Csd1 [Geomicrobium sp. JCM 19039]GAK11818.1 CRISPR-associated protein, Csd1 family [Geomicrobium sp. JCM 19039]
MNWLNDLYNTYNRNIQQVGVWEEKKDGSEYTLLPIAHTTQQAHIEVTIDHEGDFLEASVIGKVSTVLPCTEKSLIRTSNVEPHPLHDKLMYVAGDFQKYGGKNRGKDQTPHEKYLDNLRKWAMSENTTIQVRSIYEYLKKGSLIEDLIDENVLFVDENNKLIEKWKSDYGDLIDTKPKIFTFIDNQFGAFIRINVVSPSLNTPVWKDTKMYESFITFYNDQLGEKGICYVKGNETPLIDKHPAGVRYPGDKAKLISGNETIGFRGRFKKENEAVGVGYDVSQKAHNALKWLIQKQSRNFKGRVLTVWGSKDEPLPVPNDGTDVNNEASKQEVKETKADIKGYIANKVYKSFAGYSNNLNTRSEVSILILDSATEGRMAIVYYRNMNKKHYLDNLVYWHQTCAWRHLYLDESNKEQSFVGAPTTEDIAYAAYGQRVNDKIVKGFIERILPCIIDKKPIPIDIVRSTYNRAINPIGLNYKANKSYEWEKLFSISCALIRKRYSDREEFWDVALNTETTDRSYLFGRLLAMADFFERGELEANRATNAMRYMNSYVNNPTRTWSTIEQSLQPYYVRKGATIRFHLERVQQVMEKFEFEDFNNDPLSDLFTLGFYSQRLELYNQIKKGTTK